MKGTAPQVPGREWVVHETRGRRRRRPRRGTAVCGTRTPSRRSAAELADQPANCGPPRHAHPTARDLPLEHAVPLARLATLHLRLHIAHTSLRSIRLPQPPPPADTPPAPDPPLAADGQLALVAVHVEAVPRGEGDVWRDLRRVGRGQVADNGVVEDRERCGRRAWDRGRGRRREGREAEPGGDCRRESVISVSASSSTPRTHRPDFVAFSKSTARRRPRTDP